MTTILASLRHGYANLLNFNGRDTRAQFWPFALTHFALALVVWLPFFMRELTGTLDRMRAFAEANPDKATITSGPGHYSIRIHEPVPGLGPNFETLLVPIIILGAIFVVLVAAAVTRRLHDRGMRGWVGAIPALLFGLAAFMMASTFDRVSEGGEPEMGAFMTALFLNLFYNVTLLILIVLLCLPGKPEANRFGEPATAQGDHPPE